MAIDQKIMQKALDLAKTAESHGDVPVAAIILKDGEIIGQSEPRVMVDSDPTATPRFSPSATLPPTSAPPTWPVAQCTSPSNAAPCAAAPS